MWVDSGVIHGDDDALNIQHMYLFVTAFSLRVTLNTMMQGFEITANLSWLINLMSSGSSSALTGCAATITLPRHLNHLMVI